MTKTQLNFSYNFDKNGIPRNMCNYSREFIDGEKPLKKTFPVLPLLFYLDGKIFMNKNNKINKEDYDFILEQLYCEWLVSEVLLKFRERK